MSLTAITDSAAVKWLSEKSAPNWVPLLLGVCVVGAILVTYFSAKAERFDNRNILVTNASSALDRTLGQVDDRPGFGGVGAASAEAFSEAMKKKRRDRSGFMSTRGYGPDFWQINTTLGNYFAGVDLSDDMSGVTDDAAAIASAPADQADADRAAATAAAKAAAAGAAAAGASPQVQAQVAQAAAQEYFLRRPRESAQDRQKRNTSAVEDGLAAKAQMGF